MILPEVRDPRLVTVRRGGSLTDADHALLALWAAECAERVLGLFEAVRPDDGRPREAIAAARTWAAGGAAMMATRAVGGHAMGAARDLRGAPRFAAYAAGQAAVVAHVAEHDLGAAAYAVRAAVAAADPQEREAVRLAERDWQRSRLPGAVRELVLEDQARRSSICWHVFDDQLDDQAGYGRGVRIVSLIPSATEILFAVGAGDDVVGVTFECDHPPAARERRIVSTSAMPEGLSAKEVDDFVAAALRAGEDLYRLDAGALAELDADLVVTQDLCAVCAIDVDSVDDALAHLGCRADVVTLDPHTVDDVLDTVTEVGRRTGHDSEAAEVVASFRSRLAAVTSRVEGRERPRVLVLEWTDPPFAPGHWIPEMVALAGGVPSLGVAGTRSGRTTWDEAVASRPDVVVCAPCGYGLEGSAAQADGVRHRFPGVPVWAVDADAHFARPGPRLIDGIEVLAGILHPSGEEDERARRV